MKNNLFLPFALTGLVMALTACGGESSNINEDPFTGVETSSNGCLESAEKCLPFVIDYPVQGLNFDCSTDTTNHFVTELESNVASGACAVGDKVKFYIQGATTSRKITLGDVDLAKLRPRKVTGQPAQIGLVDIATAMTGKDLTKMSMDDETFKVMVGLVRIFQAVSLAQDAGIEGDVQRIDLTTELKNNLSNIASSIDVKNFVDGSYVSILRPWLDVSSINEQSAQKVAKQLILLANVQIYTTNFLTIVTSTADIQGFSGKSILNSNNESIANMYLLTTRKGYTTGYAVQWAGRPDTTTADSLTGSFARYLLLTQVSPQKLNANAQLGWINPLNKKIESSNPFILTSASNLADTLKITQGTLLNNSNIVGSEFMYKAVTASTTAPTAESIVYSKWSQTLNNDQYEGKIDVFKTNPATYLNNEVFKTINTVKTGEQYIFPLYANLIFKFTDTTIPAVKLGMVIDEDGDIRTNIGPNATATDLSSAQCTEVDSNSYKDSTTGVQQYRIGTTGAANYGVSDKSITIRMILANPIFGNIDGAIVGLNESLVFLPGSSITSTNTKPSGGVRLNLQRLLVNSTTANGINVTGWDGSAPLTAQWLNIFSNYQSVFNVANKDKASQTQLDLAKRSGGTLEIELPSCYTLKTK